MFRQLLARHPPQLLALQVANISSCICRISKCNECVDVCEEAATVVDGEVHAHTCDESSSADVSCGVGAVEGVGVAAAFVDVEVGSWWS